MWETQARKFTTSKKANIDFRLLGFSGTKIVSWNCQVDNYTNSRYDMILGRYLLTAVGLDLKFPQNIVIGDEGPYNGCSRPMAEVRNHDFKNLTKK